MRPSPVSLRVTVFLFFIVLGLLSITACRSAEESTPTQPDPAELAATSTQPPTEPSPPTVVDTPAPAEPTEAPPTEVRPTVTSPVPTPTPTAPITPTSPPAPPPEPTLYTITEGDTLVSIAENFGVTLDMLLYANGYTSPDELFLAVGDVLQIPVCEAYRVESGNTLAGIAELCDVTLDELITANIAAIAPFGSLEAVPIGFVLAIPQESSTPADLDCSPQPDREQVIEYSPKPGEGIFCLSQKFGVSTATIILANIGRLTGGITYGEQPLLIPHLSGALYTVTADDVANGLALANLAEWYEVAPEAITDWNGNPVTDPLSEGQQLFVVGADLIFGPFQFPLPAPEESSDSNG